MAPPAIRRTLLLAVAAIGATRSKADVGLFLQQAGGSQDGANAILSVLPSEPATSCAPIASATALDLSDLLRNNCHRVMEASKNFQALASHYSRRTMQAWEERVARAQELCTAAHSATSWDQAARLALEAWGTVLMQGRECCNVAGPPFCVSSEMTKVGHLIPCLIALGIFAMASMSPGFCRRSIDSPQLLRLRAGTRNRLLEPKHRVSLTPTPAAAADAAAALAARGLGPDAAPGASHGAAVAAEIPPPSSPRAKTGPTATGAATSAGATRSPPRSPPRSREGSFADLGQELEALFTRSSSLRALPGAEEWAAASAGLFAALQKAYGFQEASVKNQYEHFLSLWRSQCSMVADRIYDTKATTALDESGLLQQSLKELHVELLDGFRRYRERVRRQEAKSAKPGRRAAAAAAVTAPAALPLPGQWPAPTKLGSQMAEIAVFLLVWGEAGNARFMPELLCFIVDLLLTADPARAPYSQSPPVARSSPFLVRIVRPIYAMVFDETYQYVKVKDGKDVKALHKGFEKFLPADTLNYDDWNELFCDPERVVHSMMLQDGSKLFDLPPGERFAALEQVDWKGSLQGTKTHREVHSLWGVFAAVSRVAFLHELLFLCTFVAVSTQSKPYDEVQVITAGKSPLVALATVGLLVPIHSACWHLSRWFVSGAAQRDLRIPARGCCMRWRDVVLEAVHVTAVLAFWASPIFTYVAVRYVEFYDDQPLREVHPRLNEETIFIAHFFVCTAGAAVLLVCPAVFNREHYSLIKGSYASCAVRWIFWVLVLSMKVFVSRSGIAALDTAIDDLQICRPGREDVRYLRQHAFSPNWDKDTIEWLVLMATGYVLYIADTQFWFTLGCSLLGVLVAMQQRGWRLCDLTFADLVAKIPERFSEKVLYFEFQSMREKGRFSSSFPILWDKVVEHMRYEDKVDDKFFGNLSFFTNYARGVDWHTVQEAPTQPACTKPGGTQMIQVRMPQIFAASSCAERLFRRNMTCFKDPAWPENAEAQWRLDALARALTLDMPRPFRAPYIPGLTVLIPHYGESILAVKQELYKEGTSEGDFVVPLMSWMEYRYEEEFRSFTSRMQQLDPRWTRAGNKWSEYPEEDWDKLCAWASMRSQTLWRTVAGMMLYHQALECHYVLQGDRMGTMGKRKFWNVEEVFTCLISMQMYAYFNDTQLQHTNRMLEKHEKSLKIAFIDMEDKGPNADRDGVHQNQQRRYYSCLIDRSCPVDERGRRRPRLRIELPGFPILGDGKGDNQNHAIPFTRGLFIQAIDANQGGYFEQNLLLPCVLGEFRNGSRKIIGFPEHITSDIGTIGDFAAGAETAFGTILQRTYAVLGARMHYGHPDMMNKAFMIQQGGVSKATKTVNLSEDIFAGMDFTLRGNGREIVHAEYYHVCKGRDLGFNTVLLFYSKVSAGMGEQMLTRQAYRLSEHMALPEFLTFYYAHGGFYITQYLLSKCMPLLVYIWLLVILDDAESNFEAMDARIPTKTVSGRDIMARLLLTQFGSVMVLFLVGAMAPLLLETWLQSGFLAAAARFAKQMFTLAPLHFIFQAKIIGAYISNEVLYGGASYVSTGRGLPTERRFFIGIKNGVSGLYNDFAPYALYDGARLLASSVLVVCAGGIYVESDKMMVMFWWCLALSLTIASWLFAPFIFNPYQYACVKFQDDLQDWRDFFLSSTTGQHSGDPPWMAWYTKTQLKPGSGIRSSLTSVAVWILFVASWYTVLVNKMHNFTVIFSGQFFSGTIPRLSMQMLVVMPPCVLSGLFCTFVPQLRKRFGQSPLHLSSVAMVSVVLDCGEAALELVGLLTIGWWKSVLVGLLLKYSWLALLLVLSECLFRLRHEPPRRRLGKMLARSVKLWLLAHRMARDILVSSLIFFALSFGVLLDYIYRAWCGCRCSPHNLLVYRDPGHPTHVAEELMPPAGSAQTWLAGVGGFTFERLPNWERGRRASAFVPGKLEMPPRWQERMDRLEERERTYSVNSPGGRRRSEPAAFSIEMAQASAP